MGFLDKDDEDVIDVGDPDGNMAPVPPAGDNDFVKPVDNPEEVVAMYQQFDKIKHQLLDQNKDLTKIGSNIHINKSGWRKIATMFNLSVGTFEDERIIQEREGNDIVKWRVKAKVTAPNEKASVGSGMAASNESNHMDLMEKRNDISDTDHPDVVRVDGKWRVIKDPAAVNEHNIYAIAETRAKNRAISDMVGGGEVSAEEMGSEFYLE